MMIHQELGFLSAILVGLLGSAHCIGMCGGIVTAFSTGIDTDLQKPGRVKNSLLLSYNLGRIVSYTVIGLLAGFLGAGLFSQLDPFWPRVLAALFMVALGLYLTGWWRGLALLERAGYRVWKYIQPLGKRLLPIRAVPQAFGFGLVWGWLPCGLVYAVLVWALSTGDPLQAALLMLGFGIGTLPSMLLTGRVSASMADRMRSPGIRRIAGATIILFGLASIVTVVQHAQHHHHDQGHEHHADASDTTLWTGPASSRIPPRLQSTL